MKQTSKKTLIVDPVHSLLLTKLKEVGLQVDYRPYITYTEALGCIPDYFGLVIRTKFRVDSDFLAQAKHLRFIARAGAGMDNIDEDDAKKKGISVFNAPEGNRNAVAEHALGMILGLLNHSRKADQEVRAGLWQRLENTGTELQSKTIGIIGYGFMGSALAEKLSALGVKVLAYDKYKTGYCSNFVQEVGMDTIFNETDILSLHLPLNEETKNLVNTEFLSKFKKSIYLINTARGEIVNLKDLLDALKKPESSVENSGKVIAAALDVLPCETFPLSNKLDIELFNELIKCNNVLLSPHVAGWTTESYAGIAQVLATKITHNLPNLLGEAH